MFGGAKVLFAMSLLSLYDFKAFNNTTGVIKMIRVYHNYSLFIDTLEITV